MEASKVLTAAARPKSPTKHVADNMTFVNVDQPTITSGAIELVDRTIEKSIDVIDQIKKEQLAVKMEEMQKSTSTDTFYSESRVETSSSSVHKSYEGAEMKFQSIDPRAVMSDMVAKFATKDDDFSTILTHKETETRKISGQEFFSETKQVSSSDDDSLVIKTETKHELRGQEHELKEKTTVRKDGDHTETSQKKLEKAHEASAKRSDIETKTVRSTDDNDIIKVEREFTEQGLYTGRQTKSEEKMTALKDETIKKKHDVKISERDLCHEQWGKEYFTDPGELEDIVEDDDGKPRVAFVGSSLKIIEKDEIVSSLEVSEKGKVVSSTIEHHKEESVIESKEHDDLSSDASHAPSFKSEPTERRDSSEASPKSKSKSFKKDDEIYEVNFIKEIKVTTSPVKSTFSRTGSQDTHSESEAAPELPHDDRTGDTPKKEKPSKSPIKLPQQQIQDQVWEVSLQKTDSFEVTDEIPKPKVTTSVETSSTTTKSSDSDTILEIRTVVESRTEVTKTSKTDMSPITFELSDETSTTSKDIMIKSGESLDTECMIKSLESHEGEVLQKSMDSTVSAETLHPSDFSTEADSAYLTGTDHKREEIKLIKEKSLEDICSSGYDTDLSSAEFHATKLESERVDFDSLMSAQPLTDLSVLEKTIDEVKQSLEAAQGEIISEKSDGSSKYKQSPSEFQFKLLISPDRPEVITEEQHDDHDKTIVLSEKEEKILDSQITESISQKISSQDDTTTSDEEKDTVHVKESSPPLDTGDLSIRSDSGPHSIIETDSEIVLYDRDKSISSLEVKLREQKHIKSMLGVGDRRSASEVEGWSSSGESHYHSFEHSESRPLSSDIEVMMTAQSGTEFETATSHDVSSQSLRTSKDYFTAGSSLASRDSMKSLDSDGSSHVASIDISDASETLVPSANELKEELMESSTYVEQFLHEVEKEQQKVKDVSDEEVSGDEEENKIDLDEPVGKMKRSHEMRFQPKDMIPEYFPIESASESADVDEDSKDKDGSDTTISSQLKTDEILSSSISKIDMPSSQSEIVQKNVKEEVEDFIKVSEEIKIVKESFKGVKEALTHQVKVVKDEIEDGLKEAKGVKNEFKDTKDKVKEKVKETKDTIKEEAKDGFKVLKDEFKGGKLVTEFEAKGELKDVKEKIEDVEDYVKIVEERLKEVTGEVEQIKSEAKHGFAEIKEPKDHIKIVEDELKEVKKEILEGKDIKDEAKHGFAEIKVVKDGIKEFKEEVKEHVKVIEDGLKEVKKEMQEGKDAVEEIKGEAHHGIAEVKEVKEEVKEHVKVVEGRLKEVKKEMQDGKDAVKEIKGEAHHGIAEIKEVKDGIKEEVKEPVKVIVGGLKEVKEEGQVVKDAVKEIEVEAKHGFAEVKDEDKTVRDGIKEFEERVKEHVKVDEDEFKQVKQEVKVFKDEKVELKVLTEVFKEEVKLVEDGFKYEIKDELKDIKDEVKEEVKEIITKKTTNKEEAIPFSVTKIEKPQREFVDVESDIIPVGSSEYEDIVRHGSITPEPRKLSGMDIAITKKTIHDAESAPSEVCEIVEECKKKIVKEVSVIPFPKTEVPPSQREFVDLEQDIIPIGSKQYEEILKSKSDSSVPKTKVEKSVVKTPDSQLDSKQTSTSSLQTHDHISTPHTPLSAPSQSSLSTDNGREYVLDDMYDISETPELRSDLAETSKSELVITTEEKTIHTYEKEQESPTSDEFEMVDKPSEMDDFVVIEEVAKEAQETDTEGKSVQIKSQKFEKRHDIEIEEYLSKTSKKQESISSASGSLSDEELLQYESEQKKQQAQELAEIEAGRRWIQMQFEGDPRYDYERVPLEDIKEEEMTDFDASRIGSLTSQKESIGSYGSFRNSYGSLSESEMASRIRFRVRGDNDDISISSLQEFENLEKALMEQYQQHSSSSQDSLNGSLPRRYILSRSQGDDISVSSLQEFEGLESACLEALKAEILAKQKEALLMADPKEVSGSFLEREKRSYSGSSESSPPQKGGSPSQKSGSPSQKNGSPSQKLGSYGSPSQKILTESASIRKLIDQQMAIEQKLQQQVTPKVITVKKFDDRGAFFVPEPEPGPSEPEGELSGEVTEECKKSSSFVCAAAPSDGSAESIPGDCEEMMKILDQEEKSNQSQALTRTFTDGGVIEVVRTTTVIQQRFVDGKKVSETVTSTDGDGAVDIPARPRQLEESAMSYGSEMSSSITSQPSELDSLMTVLERHTDGEVVTVTRQTITMSSDKPEDLEFSREGSLVRELSPSSGRSVAHSVISFSGKQFTDPASGSWSGQDEELSSSGSFSRLVVFY